MKENSIRSRKEVSLLDLATLSFNIERAALNPQIGFEDYDKTKKELLRGLERHTEISTRDLESALWSCNLLNEKGLFFSPTALTFQEFVKGFLDPGEMFDERYNYFRKVKRNV